MDDQRVGSMVRAARLRRGWRQHDLARAARTSDATVSRVERGHFDVVSLAVVRRIAAALDIRIELVPRSRSADLDRLVNARHADLAEAVIGRLRSMPGWEVRPEVSFGIYGERGVIDLLAWHARRRALLVIELKTEVVDVGELLGTLDRKRRLGPTVARQLGWDPETISTWLAVAESMTSRRRVTAHVETFRAALPGDGRRLRSWLADPSGELRALSFVTDRHGVNVRSSFATLRRVPTRPGSRQRVPRRAA